MKLKSSVKKMTEVLTEVKTQRYRGYKLATIFLKTQRKSVSFEKINTKEPRKHAIFHHRLFPMNP